MISLWKGLYTRLLSIIDTMSERVSGSGLTWKLSLLEKTCSTLDSVVRWHTVWLKTKKCKGNRICRCHIISTLNILTLTTHDKFFFWKTWPPPNLIGGWIQLRRLSHFGLKNTYTTKSYFLLTPFFPKHPTWCPEGSRNVDLTDHKVDCGILNPIVEVETPWKWKLLWFIATWVNLVWDKLRDYAISRANPILIILMFLIRVVMFCERNR